MLEGVRRVRRLKVMRYDLSIVDPCKYCNKWSCNITNVFNVHIVASFINKFFRSINLPFFTLPLYCLVVYDIECCLFFTYNKPLRLSSRVALVKPTGEIFVKGKYILYNSSP